MNTQQKSRRQAMIELKGMEVPEFDPTQLNRILKEEYDDLVLFLINEIEIEKYRYDIRGALDRKMELEIILKNKGII
jgi:hypothetical protein